jgi:translation initiation factor 1
VELKMSDYRKENSRTVYSTSGGRVCPDCGKPINECECHLQQKKPQGDGIALVRREVKGRRGKTVTTISGIQSGKNELLDLATELKRHCGTGGSVKNEVIIIQGDHGNSIIQFLERKGIKTKRAGGYTR